MNAVTTVATPSAASATRERPGARVRLVALGVPMPRRLRTVDREIDGEQRDRDRDRRRRRLVALGSPVPAEHDGDENERDRSRAQPDLREQRTAVELAPSAPTSCETPKTSSRFEMTLPGERAEHDARRPSVIASSAMINSGALPKLAFRKPPIPGPVCSAACSVDSPISHASGISASAGEHEQQRLSASSSSRRGSSRARGRATPRGSGGPRRELAYRAVLEAVLFDWGDTLMRGSGRRAARGRARRRTRRDRPRARPGESRSGSARRTCRCFFAPASSRRSTTRRAMRALLAGRRRGRRRRARPLPRGRARRLAAGASARVDDARAARDAARPRPEARPRLERLRSAGAPACGARAARRRRAGRRRRLLVGGRRRRKPDPAIFCAALERLGVAPEHALIVGDTSRGHRAARRRSA